MLEELLWLLENGLGLWAWSMLLLGLPQYRRKSNTQAEYFEESRANDPNKMQLQEKQMPQKILRMPQQWQKMQFSLRMHRMLQPWWKLITPILNPKKATQDLKLPFTNKTILLNGYLSIICIYYFIIFHR